MLIKHFFLIGSTFLAFICWSNCITTSSMIDIDIDKINSELLMTETSKKNTDLENSDKSKVMWRFVSIRPEPPRSLKNKNVSLAEGLGTGTRLSIGVLNQKPDTLKLREDIYQNGKVVYAAIVKKNHKDGFFSDTYSITIDIESLSGKVIQKTITSCSKDLHSSVPDGEKIIGLEHEGNFLFGEELSCTFRLSVVKNDK